MDSSFEKNLYWKKININLSSQIITTSYSYNIQNCQCNYSQSVTVNNSCIDMINNKQIGYCYFDNNNNNKICESKENKYICNTIETIYYNNILNYNILFNTTNNQNLNSNITNIITCFTPNCFDDIYQNNIKLTKYYDPTHPEIISDIIAIDTDTIIVLMCFTYITIVLPMLYLFTVLLFDIIIKFCKKNNAHLPPNNNQPNNIQMAHRLP